MENTETIQFTKKLTKSIFEKLYLSYEEKEIKEPKKPSRKVFKDPPAKSFRRLETDSSEEEFKPYNAKASVHIQTEDFLYLQEELIKKDVEIQQLKQILQETQEKLQKKSVLEPINNKESSEEEHEKESSKKPEKKFVEKFEDLIFVSKKNKLLFDEENKEKILGAFEDVKGNLSVNQFEKEKSEKNLKIEKVSVNEKYFGVDRDKSEEFGKQGKDIGLDFRSGRISTPKVSEILPRSPSSKSSFKVALNPLKNSAQPRIHQATPLSSSILPDFSFENTERTPIPNQTPDLPKETSLKSLNSCLSSIDSFRKFEAMLSSTSNNEVSNMNLSLPDPQVPIPSKTLKEVRQSFLNQGTSTDWNDPEIKMREDFTYDPVFQIISNNPEPVTKKKSIKRSRNSSLPWIDDSVIEEKPTIKLKPKKKQGSRPKTQEKPPVSKQQPAERMRFQGLRKQQGVLWKENRVQIHPRANSHGKTKVKPKKVEKNSHRHLEKEDILDDIIFDEEQDTATWNKLMNKFRQNPVIISRLLRSRGRPSTQEDYQKLSNTKNFERVNHVNHIGRTSLDVKPETSSINSVIDFRPISAPEITPKPLTQNSRRIKDPDWSSSVLETYVSQKKMKFNFFSDFSLLGSQDIEEHIRSLQSGLLLMEDQKVVYKKAVNTLNTLKKELNLPEFWVSLPPFYTESLAQALSKCQKLMKARSLTVKAIELIHYRESLLLDIMSFGRENKEKFADLEKINEELLQVLVFWKYMELPFTCFMYLGEDYYAKIHEDNSNLATIFPHFQVENIFKAQVTNDSFNFDI